jgi:hypothetical protein
VGESPSLELTVPELNVLKLLALVLRDASDTGVVGLAPDAGVSLIRPATLLLLSASARFIVVALRLLRSPPTLPVVLLLQRLSRSSPPSGPTLMELRELLREWLGSFSLMALDARL